MEVREGERIIIAKPVASRPACSNFFSFSELINGTANSSPSSACSKNAVTLIRPKTVRLRPVVSHAPSGLIFSQVISWFVGLFSVHVILFSQEDIFLQRNILQFQPEKIKAPVCKSSDAVVRSFNKSIVVHKPLAKLLSETSVSLLADLDIKACHQEGAQAEAHTQLNNKLADCLILDLSSDLHQNVASQSESEKTIEPSKIESINLLQPTGKGDQSSFDGYNWRKYGQKPVKGSEYPRSYNKCTHPHCPVKKKVERSVDGQIKEIVYMGEHNHSKPPTRKNTISGGQGEGLVSVGTVDTGDNLLQGIQLNEDNEGSEAKLKNQSEAGLSTHSTYPIKLSICCNLLTTGTFEAGVAVHDNSSNGANFEEVSKELEAEVDEPKSKRRKNMTLSEEAGISREDVQEPQMVVQCSTDTENMRDGFRWRKYGQKVMKGKSYPRSYYRCTSPKCNVRKHVERASDDPRSFITTYEGKHNHNMPIKNVNAVTSKPPSKAATSKNEL